ncbi:MAG: hypothetical protein GF387_00680 [Candidatus Portnoybacteria bacterium]|nr:hypothetical protein [Candidatus Portnoybacteria bacterium]
MDKKTKIKLFLYLLLTIAVYAIVGYLITKSAILALFAGIAFFSLISLLLLAIIVTMKTIAER